MCGLCGEVRFDGRRVSRAAVLAMRDVLEPRGPDGEGLHVEERVALGHRRLAVVDLSSRGAQPMVDDATGLAVVYNGMIYNHRELRAELEGLGHGFRSTSDTEVLLVGYRAWGEGFVERLDGMFAFALWDRSRVRLLLVRGRLGIKPLYFAEIEGGLRFASSLPALVAAGGVDTEIDPVGLHHYMSFQGAIPAPHTLLRGVRKLEPGHLMRIDADGTTSNRAYWQLSIGPLDGDAELDEDAWRDHLHEALRRAVQRHMLADIPVGVLLSGGLDSSLIVALLAEAGAPPPATFSVGFETVSGEAGDEFLYSRQVAERFGTDHHEIRIGEDDLLGAIEPCVGAMSEPLVTPDVAGFYLLAQQVSQHLRVVQSGQGADELFAGYRWYSMVQLASPGGPGVFAMLTLNRNHADYLRAVHPRFAGEDASFARVKEAWSGSHASNDLDHALHFDTTVRLPEDPLKRVDDMTMAFGVEGRVPFLAREVVELAARIPARLKTGSGGKHLLKQVAWSLLPDDVIDRKKAYFPVPPLKHLEGRFFELARDVITSSRARERELLSAEYFDALLAEPSERGASVKLWQAAVLELWLDKLGI